MQMIGKDVMMLVKEKPLAGREPESLDDKALDLLAAPIATFVTDPLIDIKTTL